MSDLVEVKQVDFSRFEPRKCIRCSAYCTSETCNVEQGRYLTCPGCGRYMYNGITPEWAQKMSDLKKKSSNKKDEEQAEVNDIMAKINALNKSLGEG